MQAVFNFDYFISNFNATRINVQGGFFLKINKRADQNKAVLWGFFFSKSINIHACLFGTLENVQYRIYLCYRGLAKQWGSTIKTFELLGWVKESLKVYL